MGYQVFNPKQGQTAASYQKQTKNNFTHGLGAGDWTWDKEQGRFIKPGSTAPKTGASAPSTGGSGGSGGLVPSGITGSGGGSGSPSPVVAPPSMAAMADGAMGGGSGAEGSSPTGVIGAPSRFRQGIGTRMLPQESVSLAALRKVY